VEKQVIFRDYQEQTASDHNNLQSFARVSFEHIVDDAVTKSHRYAGFNVTKSAQAEIAVAPGRFYQAGGAVFARSSSLTQSMVPYLAAASKRIVAVSVFGQENDTDVTERDFLVNVETNQTEPDSVALTRARDAVLAFTAGSESPDPQAPAIPVAHVTIAHVLLDPTQVLSVTMLTDNAVASTEVLDQRTDVLEEFRRQIEPRVASLASDLAALANQIRQKGEMTEIASLYVDIARMKERLELPDDASAYGADRFLDDEESDAQNAQSLGYDARIDEGLRFAPANESAAEMDVFSANDPNARLSNGLLLPAYSDVLKLQVGPMHSDLGIAQYGFQTHDVVQRTISRQRIRYGAQFKVSSSKQWWLSGEYDPATRIFSKDGESFLVLDPDKVRKHKKTRLVEMFIDAWDESYWDHLVLEHQIVGAQVAQSFLVSNDMWLTKVGFYLTAKGADEAVHLTLCETANGVPDLSKAILQVSVPHTALLQNAWNRVQVTPTFLRAGGRYALVLTSNAAHRVGMAYGQSYTDGTFFYSTDGAYYYGDLTKDLMIELWGARFNSPQVAIELKPINLDGGMRAIDILAGTIAPESTELIYEIKAPGGDWVPLAPGGPPALTGAPPLVQFRARFIGTRDMQPGLMLAGSRLSVSRPKTSFRHVSTPITLAAASNNIFVRLLLEYFDDTPHDCTCRLRIGGTDETPDVVTDRVVSAADGRIERTFNFQLGAAVSGFTVVIDGATNSPASMFHAAERIHWAL
jgi:hypothetical protein